jgi:hypothetical protein
MISKKLALLCLGFLSVSAAFASVTFVPQFEEERFLPADTYHATCSSRMDLDLSLDANKFTN